jgi:hypothetical protein
MSATGATEKEQIGRRTIGSLSTLGMVATVKSVFACKSGDWFDEGVPVSDFRHVRGGRLEPGGSRGGNSKLVDRANDLIVGSSSDSTHVDGNGSSMVASVAEIKVQGRNPNLGQFHGVDDAAADDFVFVFRLNPVHPELQHLKSTATRSLTKITKSISVTSRDI